MTNKALLIGEEIDSAFFALNSSLRSKTIEHSNGVLEVSRDQYSPWLAYTTKLSSINPYLFDFMPTERGDLIRNERYIKAAADFLSYNGQEAVEELAGDVEPWLPSLENLSDQFKEARNLVKATGLAMETTYNVIVDYVVPLGGLTRRGYSTHYLRGAIFRTFPPSFNASHCALDIIHELGHQVLALWQSADPILTTPPKAPVFSQIRQENRPAIQSYHAAVALAFMLRLQQAHPNNMELQEAAKELGAEYSVSLHNSLKLALQSLRSGCHFTDIGEEIIREMEALLEKPDLSLAG